MGFEPTRERRRHMPTKLRVEDRFDLGHGISFTWRQGGIVLVGLVAGYLVWNGASAWPPLTFWKPLPLVLAALVVLLFVAAALVKIQDRYPESWFAIWLAFQRLPKVYRWQPVGPPAPRRQEGDSRRQRKPVNPAAREEEHLV